MASLLGIAALLAAGSVQAQESTCNDPDLSDRRAIWSATLTVGEVTGTGTETHKGYYKQGSSVHGALNLVTFELYPRGIWRIDRVLENESGRLSFRAQPTEYEHPDLLTCHKDALVLHVCDREFAFRNKTHSAFTVTASGSATSVSSVSVSGATVTLVLAEPVVRNENVTLSYTAPPDNPIRDIAGTDAGDLMSGHIVTNVTAELPGVPSSPNAVRIDDGRSGSPSATMRARNMS